MTPVTEDRELQNPITIPWSPALDECMVVVSEHEPQVSKNLASNERSKKQNNPRCRLIFRPACRQTENFSSGAWKCCTTVLGHAFSCSPPKSGQGDVPSSRSRSPSPEVEAALEQRTGKGRSFFTDLDIRLCRGNMDVIARLTGWLRGNVLTILNIMGVFVGVIMAIIMRGSREDKWTQREIVYVGFIGDLFLRMLKCLILPLIISSMISAVGSLDLTLSGRIGIRAIVYYMTTTISAVILGIILVITIHPGEGSEKGITRAGSVRNVTTVDMLMDLVRNLFPPNLVQACTSQYKTILIPPPLMVKNTSELPEVMMNTSLMESASNVTPSYLEWTNNDGPGKWINDSLSDVTNESLNSTNSTTKPNPLYEWRMAEGQEEATNILGLVVFSTVLGITLGKLGPKGKPLLNFFTALSEATMMITGWVIWLSPVGVLFLVSAKMLEMESWQVMLGQLGMYFLTVMIGLFIHGFIVLQTIYFVITRKLPFRFVSNLSEALATAFATSSSSATLPVALACLEEKNGVDPRVTRFVMPIGATINMDGTALYEAVAAIFISQVRGIQLTIGSVIAVSITATAASIGAAGIPQAGIVTMVMVLDTLGLPAEDVTLILAVDWFLDRFRTFTNVLGDSLGAGIVHHLSRKELSKIPQISSKEPNMAIELDGPFDADVEKGEANGLTSQKNANVTSTAAVEVEWQSTSM